MPSAINKGGTKVGTEKKFNSAVQPKHCVIHQGALSFRLRQKGKTNTPSKCVPIAKKKRRVLLWTPVDHNPSEGKIIWNE